jgi:hypothetical protein
MEERLIKLFECARLEGTCERDLISKLYGEASSKVSHAAEYWAARKHGLSILQAELSVLLAQDLRLHGPEGLLTRFECLIEPPSTVYYKKRHRKAKDEPSPKKKSKL